MNQGGNDHGRPFRGVLKGHEIGQCHGRPIATIVALWVVLRLVENVGRKAWMETDRLNVSTLS